MIVRSMIARAVMSALAMTVASTLVADTSPPARAIAYPSEYREWTHVKTAIAGPQSPGIGRFAGIHHIYANDIAMDGYRGGQFRDGAVIVFDLFEAKEAGGSTAEGARKFIDVMEKNTQLYAASGGWGFEEFRGDSRTEGRLTQEQATQCAACHQKLASDDLVVGTFRK